LNRLNGIEQGLIQIFCPDSIDKDSFYNKHIHPFIENHVRYDKMICHEIVEKSKTHTSSGKAIAAAVLGDIMLLILLLDTPGYYVSHMFSMSGAFLKCFLDGFHNDDVL
jgi:esterase/lipase superfamily enzyme